MNYETHIKTSGIYRMQTQDGQWIVGQFLIERINKNQSKISKFIANIEFEMVYMNVEGNIHFQSEGEFYSFLNANIDNEVFGKANFEGEPVTVTQKSWTLTLG